MPDPCAKHIIYPWHITSKSQKGEDTIFRHYELPVSFFLQILAIVHRVLTPLSSSIRSTSVSPICSLAAGDSWTV